MKKPKYISCSAVGRAAFCPQALKLEAQGIKPTKEAVERMDRGEVAHQKFNNELTQDKRCFIATACFGPDDTTTQFYRDYRDNVLKKTAYGKSFIAVYYAISPYFLKIARDIPGVMKVSKKCLVLLRHKLEK